MKKNQRAATPSRREDFEQRLHGYSALGAATVALGAVASASATPTLTNITLGDLTITSGPAVGTHTAPVFNASSLRSSVENVGFHVAGVGGVAGRTFFLAMGGGAATVAHRLNTYSRSASINGSGVGFRGVHGGGRSWNLADLISQNQPVKSGVFRFSGGYLVAKAAGFGQPSATGNFATAPNHAKSGYVGFHSTHQNYYGWLRVKVTMDANGLPSQLTLVDTNTPGIYGAFGPSSILAGQTAAIPEAAGVAAGLALFALGAAGVREHRRRRQAA